MIGCCTSRMRMATGATTTSRMITNLAVTDAVSSLPKMIRMMATRTITGMSARASRRRRRWTCAARSANQVVAAKTTSETMLASA